MSGFRVLPPVAALGLAFLACDITSPEYGQLVFILAGQSNMVGAGQTQELMPEQLVLPTNVRYFRGVEETTLAEHERFGPEVTLSQELARVFPNRELVFVKQATGGTSLFDWAPQWDSAQASVTENAGKGPLYSQLFEVLRGIRLDPNAEVGALFWMQGERDALFEEAGSVYFENLRELISAFRRDLADENLPFLLGLVNPPPERYPAVALVRDAQRKAATEILGVGLVETDGLAKWDDDLHYRTEGVLELGSRFAEAYFAEAYLVRSTP